MSFAVLEKIEQIEVSKIFLSLKSVYYAWEIFVDL